MFQITEGTISEMQNQNPDGNIPPGMMGGPPPQSVPMLGFPQHGAQPHMSNMSTRDAQQRAMPGRPYQGMPPPGMQPPAGYGMQQPGFYSSGAHMQHPGAYPGGGYPQRSFQDPLMSAPMPPPQSQPGYSAHSMNYPPQAHMQQPQQPFYVPAQQQQPPQQHPSAADLATQQSQAQVQQQAQQSQQMMHQQAQQQFYQRSQHYGPQSVAGPSSIGSVQPHSQAPPSVQPPGSQQPAPTDKGGFSSRLTVPPYPEEVLGNLAAFSVLQLCVIGKDLVHELCYRTSCMAATIKQISEKRTNQLQLGGNEAEVKTILAYCQYLFKKLHEVRVRIERYTSSRPLNVDEYLEELSDTSEIPVNEELQNALDEFQDNRAQLIRVSADLKKLDWTAAMYEPSFLKRTEDSVHKQRGDGSK